MVSTPEGAAPLMISVGQVRGSIGDIMALYKYFCAMEGLGVLPRPRLTKPSRPRRGPWPDRPQGRLDRLCAIIRVHWNGRMQFRCSVIPLAPRARRK